VSSPYKGIPCYPCPSDRSLTDEELERIRYAGEKMLEVFACAHVTQRKHTFDMPDRIEEWVIQPTGGALGADTWELGVLVGVNGKAWSAINAVLDAGGQINGCSADATKAGSS
jgi:hypothetical protein